MEKAWALATHVTGLEFQPHHSLELKTQDPLLRSVFSDVDLPLPGHGEEYKLRMDKHLAECLAHCWHTAIDKYPDSHLVATNE